MPYSSVSELPAAVKAKLKGKPKKLRQWMHVWNSEYAANKDESRAFASAWAVVEKAVGMTQMNENLNFFLPITKIDREQRMVSGYASTSCLDSDGEIISQEALKAALPDYMQYANIREMHRPSAVGRAHEANLDSKGLYITAKVGDDVAWRKVCDKIYNGFSIGGRRVTKVGNTITKLNLTEISLVDRPANPEAVFDFWKAEKPVEGAPVELVAGADLSKAETIADEVLLAKKAAKRLAKLEKLSKRAKLAKQAESAPTSSPAAPGVEGGAEAALGKGESRHELVLERRPPALLQGEDTGALSLTPNLKLRKGKKMDEKPNPNEGALGKALIQLLAQNGMPKLHPAVPLLKAAESDMKSMKQPRKDAEDCVKALFNMHKGALAKGETSRAGLNHESALSTLQKLYDDLGTMKSISKSARNNIEKAAGRVSAPGTVEDGIGGLYTPDPGGNLQTISPGEMDNLPAHKGGGQGGDLTKFVSEEQVGLLVKAARLEAENELLKRMPAAPSGGRRPSGFDLSKLSGNGLSADSPLLKGVNVAELQSSDQRTRDSAVSKVFGNYLLQSPGKTVLDPDFHGTAGLGNSSS